jgi:hypothetical protein
MSRSATEEMFRDVGVGEAPPEGEDGYDLVKAAHVPGFAHRFEGSDLASGPIASMLNSEAFVQQLLSSRDAAGVTFSPVYVSLDVTDPQAFAPALNKAREVCKENANVISAGVAFPVVCEGSSPRDKSWAVVELSRLAVRAASYAPCFVGPSGAARDRERDAALIAFASAIVADPECRGYMGWREDGAVATFCAPTSPSKYGDAPWFRHAWTLHMIASREGQPDVRTLSREAFGADPEASARAFAGFLRAAVASNEARNYWTDRRLDRADGGITSGASFWKWIVWASDQRSFLRALGP